MNEWFIVFAKNSPDALVVTNQNGVIIYNNAPFQTLTSQQQKDTHSNLFDTQLPEVLKTELKRAFAEIAVTKKEKKFSYEVVLAGEHRNFTCRVIPYFVTAKETILVEIKDDTESTRLKSELFAGRLSRRQEELLKERRRRLFFGLLDELPTSVYLQRKDYTVAFANKRVRKLYGDAEGQLCYKIFAGRDTPCPVCPTFEVFDTGQSVEWEFTDSNKRTFLIYDYPFEDDTGEPLVLEMGVDITDLKNVEKELYQAQKLRAIGVLAGGIAHDLNNNLVPIIFNIEYVLEKITNQHLQEPLEDALEAANQGASLVAQVLEYSRQQDVTRKPIRITPLILECIKEIEATLPDNISLVSEIKQVADHVYSNATQIRQVVLNLLKNGIQSMTKGGLITVRLTAQNIRNSKDNNLKDLTPGDYLVLEVQDTGRGIGTEATERIFEPFYTSRKAQGGTGMGLAVVHSIVNGSGGYIKVHSTQGIGTTFTVYLPQIEGDNGILEGEFCIMDGNNVNILFVDDAPNPLAAMTRSLTNAGFKVDTATNGKKGLDMFINNPKKYNLILADQSMPGMTGLELSTQILKLNPQARVVICTGHIEPALEEQAKLEGVAGFARKPMSPKTLIEIVKRHCRY